MMDSQDISGFDSEELLQLAVKLVERKKTVEALAFLKQAVKIDPENANALYFTGAVYAQMNQPERSLEMMQRAVAINPGLDIAHYQIGLFHYTAEDFDKAVEAWKPLDRLGEDNPLYLFKQGLVAIEGDDYAAGRACIERGIELNTVSEPLNDVMRTLLTGLAALEQDDEDDGEEGEEEEDL